MFSKELLNYIEFLSKRDTKNLTQKTLKTVEEIGELSKKILPYENAFATNHRIVSKTQILEEIADSMLCLLSIANDIDMMDQLESMIIKKAEIWAEKQESEIGLTFPLPYEFHVTVETNDIDGFKRICNELNVKPIVIDLQNNIGTNIMRDVMTSSKHFGDNSTAISELDNIANTLQENGFNVVRKKIETVPWHPAAPRDYYNDYEMPKDCYFECHFGVILDKNTSSNDMILNDICEKHNLHKSRNIFKIYEDGNKIIMLTARSYTGTYEMFLDRIESIKKIFALQCFEIEKVIIEFSLYDTKMKHDSAWIPEKEVAHG